MLQQWFLLGGVMMWPLLVCSILLTAYMLERLWTIGLRYRLLRLDVPEDQRAHHRHFLPFFTEIPPGLGLLGTVIGVVQSFEVSAGSVDASAVGSGLAVACITTVVGLSLGLLASASGYVLEWASR